MIVSEHIRWAKQDGQNPRMVMYALDGVRRTKAPNWVDVAFEMAAILERMHRARAA